MEEKKRVSQCRKVLGFMRLNRSITQWQAIRRFGITRLSGRIYDLKYKMNIPISDKMVSKNGKHYKEYFLSK